jgi:PAS domain S-box-containing protein
MARSGHMGDRRKKGAEPTIAGETFALLFECNPVPLFVYERASLRFIAVNDAALALYGYSRDAFLEKSIPDILPPEERPHLHGRMPLAEDGIAKVGLRRHVCADGRIIQVDLQRQEFELDGRQAALISSCDVTGRLRDEERLRQSLERLRRSEEQLARAQRVSHTGSFARDLRTDTVTWSAEALRILGLPSDWASADGRPTNRKALLERIHPEDRDRYVAASDAVAAGHARPPLECRIIRPDGSVRWLCHESEVIFDEAGKPALRLGTYRDVTEAHEAAEEQARLREALSAAHRELRAANEDLELRVKQRTEELRVAQEELLKKERLSVLGQLTATVAHELRNPLSSIRNTLFAMRGTAVAPGSALQRMIARIERAVARCDTIIADLLDYTRIHPLRSSRLKLDDWIAEVLVEQKIGDGIVLERRLAAADAQVMLDSERFRRVIINLVENAAQAIEQTGREGCITVATSADDDDALIEVADTGPGIPPEILAKVFEPLFSTKSLGTGLGLPTVKQIVEQHGGGVEIASVPSEGTTVRIRLPLAIAALAA